MSIRQRRIEKGWSQSQLAEFSGLSLRTIQRVEKGKTPTVESLKSIAAVFEVAHTDLMPNIKIDESALNEQELEELQQIRRMKRFYLELIAFLLTMPLLYLANWAFDPESTWASSVAFVWGVILAIEAYDVFEASGLLGSRWERRQLEKRINRIVE